MAGFLRSVTTGFGDRIMRALTSAILVLALAGCAAVTLVPAYDEQIDRGLTGLYADTNAFVDRMIALRGTPAGSYAENLTFYDDAEGRMAALIARAEAHRALKECPAAKVLNRALDATRLPVDVRGRIGTLAQDDCAVVLLRLIREGYGDMRRFHQAQGTLGIPPSARGPLLDGGIGALLRAGITVEIAKRTR